MGTNIGTYEYSQQQGEPIECYKFTHDGSNYLFTSFQDDVVLTFTDGQGTWTETYFALYIERTAIGAASKGGSTGLDIKVSKDNAVAKLFQGFPPEQPVTLSIYRFHQQDKNNRDIIFGGRVGQAAYEDSTCTLTCKLEDWGSRQIPRGMRSFYCQNVLYDADCQLVESNLLVPMFIDRVVGLNVYSTTFANYPDGYFSNGIFRHEGSSRMVVSHVGDCITLKYPFVAPPRDDASISPGCDHDFGTCARRFGNTLNFTGCPYVPPANPNHTAVGKGVYWVDSDVIQRDTAGYIGTISL